MKCILYYLLVIIAIFIGCNNKTNESFINVDSINDENPQLIDTCMLVNKSGIAYKPQPFDTTILLSFNGIEIGKTIKSYIGNIIPINPQIDSFGSYSKYYFESSILLDSQEQLTNIELYCINDTIVFLKAIIKNKLGWLIEMYKEKYGKPIECLPSSYLMTFIDTNGDISLSKRYDTETNKWCYYEDSYHTYSYNVWGSGPQHIVLTEEYLHFDLNHFERYYYGKWDLPVQESTSHTETILIYGNDMTFPQIVKEYSKWESYNKRQQEIQDSIKNDSIRHADLIEKEKRKKRIMNDAKQI